jgi:hypothetical protein
MTPMLRLDDPEVGFFCLGCGRGSRQPSDACACGFGPPTSRDSILDVLEHSIAPAPLDEPVGPLLGMTAERAPGGLATLREILVDAGTPHLAVDGDGTLIDPDDSTAVLVYAPEDTLGQLVHDRPAGALESARIDTEPSVVLAEFGSPTEAEIAAGRLDAAGIPYELDRCAPQLGMTTGALGQTGIRVEESDLERAAGAIALSDDNAVARRWSQADEIAMVGERRRRRFRIARVLLYLFALAYVLAAPAAYFVAPRDGFVHAALGVLMFVLARWSARAPRRAFLAGFLVVVASAVWAMVIGPPLLVAGGLLPLIATYFAFHTAVKARALQDVT